MASRAATVVAPGAATSPASPIVLEARHWRRVLEVTGLPFTLERGVTTWFELHHKIPSGPGAADARAAAHYALMDVNDAIAGRAWAPTCCKRCKGSAFGYTHTAKLCAAIASLAIELGGNKGAPATAPPVI